MPARLNEAVQHIRRGDRATGKRMLIEILKANPRDDQAWFWMAAVVDSDELREDCLLEALKHNPYNQRARQELARLNATPPRTPGVGTFEALTSPPTAVGDHQPGASLYFRFRFVRYGRAASVLTKPGMVTDQGLILDEGSLSFDDIVETNSRGRRLLITVSPHAQLGKQLSKAMMESWTLVIEVSKVKASALESLIDRACSKQAVERHRQALIRASKGGLFRLATCPECAAMIDLSELEVSSYVYCRFCHTVFTAKEQVLSLGTMYHICDECQMFDRVRGYWEVYFYFLLVVNGFSYRRRHLCDNCADFIFRSALLRNLLFILGVAPAIFMKLKSLSGREPHLRALAKANALALKGRYREASGFYERLHERFPEHPGLLMDEGIAHLAGGDVSGALRLFERSLGVCSNYLPVRELLDGLEGGTATPSVR